MDKTPYTIISYDTTIFYYDEDGNFATFRSENKSSESLLESVGRIERKIEALKRQYDLENDAKAMTQHAD